MILSAFLFITAATNSPRPLSTCFFSVLHSANRHMAHDIRNYRKQQLTPVLSIDSHSCSFYNIPYNIVGVCETIFPGFGSCKHVVKRLQLPQAGLFCFHCTNHSAEPRKNLTRVQQRLPRVTSLLSIVQRQQNQTRLCSRCYFYLWVDSAHMLHLPTKMFRK